MGNLQNDPVKILDKFNQHLKTIEKLDNGTAGQALGFTGDKAQGDMFREFSRKEAVKLGNRLKKITGMFPPGFEDLRKR